MNKTKIINILSFLFVIMINVGLFMLLELPYALICNGLIWLGVMFLVSLSTEVRR